MLVSITFKSKVVGLVRGASYLFGDLTSLVILAGFITLNRVWGHRCI